METAQVTAEVSTASSNVTPQQEEDEDEDSGSEKDEETQSEVTHKETQEVAPSEHPPVELVSGCYGPLW